MTPPSSTMSSTPSAHAHTQHPMDLLARRGAAVAVLGAGAVRGVVAALAALGVGGTVRVREGLAAVRAVPAHLLEGRKGSARGVEGEWKESKGRTGARASRVRVRERESESQRVSTHASASCSDTPALPHPFHTERTFFFFRKNLANHPRFVPGRTSSPWPGTRRSRRPTRPRRC